MDDVFRCVVCGDVSRDVGSKPIQVGIDSSSILSPRILDGQFLDIERTEWRRYSLFELENAADRILVEIVPFQSMTISSARHAELGCGLGSL